MRLNRSSLGQYKPDFVIDRFYTERGTVNTFGLMLFSIVSVMIQTGLGRFVANILRSCFEILLFVTSVRIFNIRKWIS